MFVRVLLSALHDQVNKCVSRRYLSVNDETISICVTIVTCREICIQ